jgi:uncharacterized protein with PhoU and TrkA domain
MRENEKLKEEVSELEKRNLELEYRQKVEHAKPLLNQTESKSVLTVAKAIQDIRSNANLYHLKNVHSLSDTNKKRMIEIKSTCDFKGQDETIKKQIFANKGSVQYLLNTGRQSLKFRRINHSITGKLQRISSLKRNSHSNSHLKY